jgi:hypothetical protein
MPWPMVLYESMSAASAANGHNGPAIGSVWPAERFADWMLSDEYRAQHAGKRPPYFVQLPSGPFGIDSPYSDSTHGWTVTGEPPRFSLSPSINVVGCYHGFIRDGVITDDCEGRTFAPVAA